MLNLSEAWKQAYEEYLIEESNQINIDTDKMMTELTEAHEEVKKGFMIVEKYFEMFAESEGVNLNEVKTAEPGVKNGEGNIIINNNGKSRNNNDIVGILDLIKQSRADNADYSPVANVSVTTLSNMKFPANIVFFLKQIGTWLVKIVLFFIEKIKNIIRRLIGDHDKVTNIDLNKLALDLKQVKNIETVSTKYELTGDKGPIKMYNFSDKDIALTEGITDFIVKTPEITKKERVLVTVDLAKDVEALRLSMQHFYDLFDGAFGSYNEKLFEADDLVVIFNNLVRMLEEIKNGTPSREISLSGNVVELSEISADRVKQNLVQTSTNINALKAAYTETAARIKDIAKIINSKEMLMLSDLGVDYRILTSATLGQMMPIMQSIPVRLKESAKLEKRLTKVKEKYDALVKTMARTQNSVMSLSNVAYTNSYAKRMNDLFVATRYMVDVVTLRLSGLALYVKELKDIRDIMFQLNALSRNVR